MSLLFENDAKEILRRNGIPVPKGQVVKASLEKEAYSDLFRFPVVVKALIPSGKKKKLNGIIIAEGPGEAERAIKKLIGLKIGHFIANSVYVEEFFKTEKEFFLSFFVDNLRKTLSILASSEGGIEIEELIQSNRTNIVRFDLNPLEDFRVYEAIQIGVALGVKGKALRDFFSLLMKCYRAFIDYELKLLEINPLSISPEGNFCAVGALINVDDDALSRHPELSGICSSDSDRFWRTPTELEERVIKADQKDPYRGTARYTEIEGGDIGFIGGGGGGSLMLFDSLRAKGLKPANYSEVGGNPPEEKVYELTKAVLSKMGIKGFFMGTPITNNTQVDILAKGVTRALKDLSININQFPIVIRTAGVNNEEAKRIFETNGISFYGIETTLPEAVEIMVQRMKDMR